MSNLLLQIFLLVNVFLIGILTAVAARHAYAHFRPRKPVTPKPPMTVVDPVHLPTEVKTRLIHEAEANFLAVVNGSIGELQHDLKSTAMQLNKHLQMMGSEVSIVEKERYKAMLEALRQQTEKALADAQTEISQHEVEMKAKLTEKVAAEQIRLIKQIDTKLGDAVASFLTETLQHNVDLGAQTAYLLATLEAHKEDFKREVGRDEAPQ